MSIKSTTIQLGACLGIAGALIALSNAERIIGAQATTPTSAAFNQNAPHMPSRAHGFRDHGNSQDGVSVSAIMSVTP